MNVLPVIVEASIACENVAVTVGVAPSCVAPSTGDVESTAGGTGGTVENVQFTAAGSGVSSSDLIAGGEPRRVRGAGLERGVGRRASPVRVSSS